MAETFAQYLEKWLKQSTAQGLTNPLVKMPVKRFRLLQPDEFNSIANGGTLLIGTTSDPISRNLYKNYQNRIRERGEHCGFICSGAVEMKLAQGVGQQPRTALFPVCLKRATLETSGDKIKVTVSDEEKWEVNQVLQAHLREHGIVVTETFPDNPEVAVNWVRAQMGNRAESVTSASYVGLFSSQQMVLQQRLTEPFLRQALAHNPVIEAKIAGRKVEAVELGEQVTDDGLEELGLVLPCDDHQLRVVQLSDKDRSLQVEGPPGTGKSQTIANIISNAIYHGRNVLLVCDKRAAIVQVEKRLSDSGLKPALLNLHDEGLDKKVFLRQATNSLPSDGSSPISYPMEGLRQTRKTLNDRVRFGETIAHPSLQVKRRNALAGLIQLRKELHGVPNISISNWQSLSRERLTKLLSGIAEWPEFAEIVGNSTSVWNEVRFEAFDENWNAANELLGLAERIQGRIGSLDEAREMMAAVGIELPLGSDQNVMDVLELVQIVLQRPACHPKIVGSSQFSLAELEHLQAEWEKRRALLAARHPLRFDETCSGEAENEASGILTAEAAVSWHDLSQREAYHGSCKAKIEDNQREYLRLCDQIGLVYSPLLKVRRSQFQAVLALGKFGGIIPRSWWNTASNPVLLVEGWVAKLRACGDIEQTAVVPCHFVALERMTATHWNHIEFMAEHGFNYVSYLKRFVHDRRCKYALQQAYPDIPLRGFKKWREVTLHAVAARGAMEALRASAEGHVVLERLTENYLPVAHRADEDVTRFVDHEEVHRLSGAAALVQQWRERNDLFEVGSPHWQTFWESANAGVLQQVERALSGLDSLILPDPRSNNLEDATKSHGQSSLRIRSFLQSYEKQDGDRKQSVKASFIAQKEFASCQANLASLTRYLDLEGASQSEPEWERLRTMLVWRDQFEKLRGQQKLDVDSLLWAKLAERLQDHQIAIQKAYEELDSFFEGIVDGLGDGVSISLPFSSVYNLDYNMLGDSIAEILDGFPLHPLWLEKKRWHKRMPAFPELTSLWEKIIDGSVQPDHAERLFCFNLLRLCDPIARPQGPELRQTLSSFGKQDANLALWTLDHLKAKLRTRMRQATSANTHNESELRRLAGMQRVRGTTRELIKAHLDYLIAAKPCWMMSPTSLANLLCGKKEDGSDIDVFEKHGVPFDLVIFDEASQIRVLDGLLSMAFGKQVIIVGDKHQLPPTDFFLSFASTDPDPEDFGVAESLLNEFEGVFEEDKTHVMLMSHYRSETPDLIRFSNGWFYENRLEMYPPAHISGIGRRFHYVPNATYSETVGQRSNHVNLVEAREVVKLIELHVRDIPKKSLGVVTMNIPQMELIDELLQSTPPNVQAFCADERNFFLRNLETVQGDEMDRIILSLTYGKNSSGHFNATVLGPLTKSGGERRLNVAITRSRNGMTVVSSLKASDLAASGAHSAGFKCLQAFLTDLESTQQLGNFGIENKRFEKRLDGVSNVVHCESPFEEQVVEFLENEGYELECQYGDGKFRLDIVVKERGRNLLAIECDGASYHSSLVARTRDRARARILQDRGWAVHRVWSTNWWFFEQQEKQEIIDAINAARAHSTRAATPQQTAPQPSNVDWARVSSSDGSTANSETSGPLSTDRPAAVAEVVPPPPPEVRLEEYQKANLPRAADWAELRYATSQKLVTMVTQVAETEGPVHKDVVIERIREAYGMGRVSGPARDNIERAIQVSGENGAIRSDGAFIWLRDDQLSREPRFPVDSQIEHVPPTEVKSVMVAVTRAGIPSNDLAVEVARRLGFDRIGDQITVVLEKALLELKNEGRLVESFGMLYVKEIESKIDSDGETRSTVEVAAKANEPDAGGHRGSTKLVNGLRSLALEVIDKRQSGGVLWVVGGPELARVLQQFEVQGIVFKFAPKGGPSTRERPAWWTRASL